MAELSFISLHFIRFQESHCAMVIFGMLSNSRPRSSRFKGALLAESKFCRRSYSIENQTWGVIDIPEAGSPMRSRVWVMDTPLPWWYSPNYLCREGAEWYGALEWRALKIFPASLAVETTWFPALGDMGSYGDNVTKKVESTLASTTRSMPVIQGRQEDRTTCEHNSLVRHINAKC